MGNIEPDYFMGTFGPSQYNLEHSLIQKAVRRGNVELVEKVFKNLLENGQRHWLRNRLAVIGYEECWQYANTLNFTCNDYELLEQYKAFACKVKNKDCDGLAYLANRVNDWENTAIRGDATQQDAIQKVAGAMKDDVAFWEWIEGHSLYEPHRQRIEAAKAAMNRSLKDRAIMFAAAYLSVTYPIPSVVEIEPNNNPDFQYWTAVDKHTVEGKEIIWNACKKNNFMPKRGEFLTFYCAGALCNKVQNMPFFKLMKEYKIERMGLTCAEAKATWLKLRPLIVEMSKDAVNEILERINNVKKKNDSGQLELPF